MGRKSREHKERRERCEKEFRDAIKDPVSGTISDRNRTARAGELEDALQRLADGDAVFWTSDNCPPDIRESNLEDILAFESVGGGTSLFQGLQEHGMDLPPPEKLDDQQSAEKAMDVLYALAGLRIFLIGFEHMTAREFYATLWSQTLWEGCYVEKRNPEAVTIIDVSHSLAREDMLQFLEELAKSESVH
jgi:hypothetical protein